ncbi:SCO4983 family protein [Streptomyces sp. NPDC001312]|uniref:SCO4983 family protein n=1 Tax=Streptomyces sp. NPDC001312 TaxID=3364561 RepID=UPI0036A4AE98
MYEPIRTGPSGRSVHSPMAGTTSDFPHRSREEELDIQLAGHLAALLAVTDELRALTPSRDLDTAAERLAEQVARLGGGHAPARASMAAALEPSALHQRAHALAGRTLVVAASRADTAVAILAAERMDAHAAGAQSEPQKFSGAAH